VPWTKKLANGQTLWEKLCEHYYSGQQKVSRMREIWNRQKPYVDDRRFTQVSMYLKMQEEEAIWWRESCLLYFQTFSHLPIPGKYPAPIKTLDYYKQLKFPYAPGN
jgi:alpha-glucuronidase